MFNYHIYEERYLFDSSGHLWITMNVVLIIGAENVLNFHSVINELTICHVPRSVILS